MPDHEFELAQSDEETQASLVATALVETADAYFAVSEKLVRVHSGQDEADFETLRQDASALTARAASLLREARAGLHDHSGHGCPHELAYSEVADFLGVLLEAGAALLEINSIEQVDPHVTAHPFQHFIPLVTGPSQQWLLDYADEEQKEKLYTFIMNAQAVADQLSPAMVYLVFGPLADETIEALRAWFDAGGPHGEATADEPTASVLAAHILDLHDETHDDPEADCPRFGGTEEGAIFLAGDFDPELLEPLLDGLEALEIPFRLEDRITLMDGVEVTVWTPGMEHRLTRRALDVGELRYQLDAYELWFVKAADDVQAVVDYLELDFFPGRDGPFDLVERLDALAKLCHADADE